MALTLALSPLWPLVPIVSLHLPGHSSLAPSFRFLTFNLPLGSKTDWLLQVHLQPLLRHHWGLLSGSASLGDHPADGALVPGLMPSSFLTYTTT